MEIRGKQKTKYKRLKKFELLFNELSDAMFLHDFEGRILKVNNSACEKFGFTIEEFKSMKVTDLISDDIIQSWEERIGKIKNEGQYCFETSCLTKSSEFLHVEIISKIIDIDKKKLVLTSLRDITKRKNFEKQLLELRKEAEENEFELKTIFNKAPSTIILFDEESKILRINQKGILKFNIDVNNLANSKVGDVINCVNKNNGNKNCGMSKTCIKCQLSNIFSDTINLKKEFNKQEITVEVLQNNNPVKKTMLVSTSFLKKNGKNTYLATIDDITSRKQMELDLVSAKEKAEESERLKTAFLNNISHEIRTPLNGILGFIDFFDDDSYNFTLEEKRRFIDMMHKSGDRLINTVTDLVEVSKLDSDIQPLNEVEINLYEELQNFVEEQKSQHNNPNIFFDFKIDPDLENIKIIVDKTKLLQVLKNLISNAYKFTSQGTIILHVKTTNQKLIFSISDTGIGIDPKYKTHIFEPFGQGDHLIEGVPEGVGLGLTISKKLANKMGGDIWFESRLGEGTTFYFSIHLNHVVKASISLKNTIYDEVDDLSLEGKRILIAEDEISNYLLIETILSEQGCQIIYAKNGKEAVEIFEQDTSFDIIIMDLKMPVMDGYEATRKIKAICKDVPVVAYSAYVLNGEKIKAKEMGCTDFLPKPVNKKEILTIIKKNIRMTVAKST